MLVIICFFWLAEPSFCFLSSEFGGTEAGREPAGALSARNRDSDFSLQDSGKLWGGREQDLGIGLSTYNVRGFRDPCQVNELESGQT